MKTSWMVVVMAVMMSMSARAEAQSCGADIECAEKRICVEGQCVDPNAAADESGVNVRYSDDPEEQAERLPVRFVLRPIVLPHLVLRPAAAVSILRIAGFDDTGVGVGIGAAIGLFDDLELGLIPIAFTLAPEVHSGDIFFNARYRFLDGPVELGVELGFRIPTDTFFGLTPALPVRFHIADVLAIDTGIGFPVSIADPDPFVGLVIPLRLNFQIIDMLFAGLDTGFGIGTLEQPGDSATIPLGFELGFSLPTDTGPLFDLIAGFVFPLFVFPGSSEDKIVTELYVFSLTAAF